MCLLHKNQEKFGTAETGNSTLRGTNGWVDNWYFKCANVQLHRMCFVMTVGEVISLNFKPVILRIVFCEMTWDTMSKPTRASNSFNCKLKSSYPHTTGYVETLFL